MSRCKLFLNLVFVLWIYVMPMQFQDYHDQSSINQCQACCHSNISISLYRLYCYTQFSTFLLCPLSLAVLGYPVLDKVRQNGTLPFPHWLPNMNLCSGKEDHTCVLKYRGAVQECYGSASIFPGIMPS